MRIEKERDGKPGGRKFCGGAGSLLALSRGGVRGVPGEAQQVLIILLIWYIYSISVGGFRVFVFWLFARMLNTHCGVAFHKLSDAFIFMLLVLADQTLLMR
jgi:hypothetical protein